MPTPSMTLEVAGREVKVTNPDKVFFPHIRKTKLDLVQYYLSVAEGALRGVRNRPMVLKRFPNGADEEPFFQNGIAPVPQGQRQAYMLVAIADSGDAVFIPAVSP